MDTTERNIEDEMSEDDLFYGELTKINNELVNTQRELHKKTAELDRLNKQLQAEIVERKKAEEQLRKIAIRDPLTQAYNRRHFMELSEKEMRRAVRYKSPISVVMMDIDHFKQVNDKYGHKFGDAVLMMVTKICQQILRKVDIFARYGGEEFVILMPETGKNQAAIVANRLRIEISKINIGTEIGDIKITSSFGVYEIESQDPSTSIDDYLNHADQALYESKTNGRNRVTIWDESKTKR